MRKNVLTPVCDAIRAAQYVRMSTDLQQYSIENQKAAIQQYAQQHGFIVVKTYADAGRSGVVLKHRGALTELLKDVLGGDAGYSAILVYDVSRWGRFQDADEGAHYEFLCKQAGIPIHYCAELFPNDGTLPSAIFKALKRTMAAEYSRELGVKVLSAQKRLAQLGFRMGGFAGFGLRRMLILPDGTPRQELRVGDHKGLATDRVILVPGPKKEVECVRTMYKLAMRNDVSISDIARYLNQHRSPYIDGRPWANASVGRTLRNPKYVGCNTWGKTSCRLHTRVIALPSGDWVVRPGAFSPIIDQRTFDRVQLVRKRRLERLTDEELLCRLKALLRTKGKLTEKLIANARNMPPLSTYRWRFNGWRQIYKQIGYDAPATSFSKVDSRTVTLRLRSELLGQIAALFPGRVTLFRLPRQMRFLVRVDNSFSMSLVICPSSPTQKGDHRWKLNPTPLECRYVTLLARLNRENTGFHSFYIFRDSLNK
jgi:DNA invertase Pin-like site-specific DNA recombinase